MKPRQRIAHHTGVRLLRSAGAAGVGLSHPAPASLVFVEDNMFHRRLSILASVTFVAATLSVSAQQAPATASLVRSEGVVSLNGQPVAAGAPATALGDVAEIQTKDGRLVVALKRGGTFVLGPNA